MLSSKTYQVSRWGHCKQGPSSLRISLRRGNRPLAPVQAVPLNIVVVASGEKTCLTGKDAYKVGTSGSCDVKVQGHGIASEHAVIEFKKSQFFCRALVGEDMFDSSSCFLNGTEMRPRVAYLMGSGATLGLGPGGSSQVLLQLEYQEGSGSNPLLEMMAKGLAAKSTNEDVKQALKGM
mmetsp:Transcript_2933/g.6424  ORF Transcript_2933/g.6424 Transcript_2933/m.6424 type:complete len:178 (-) Transcript_2933:941-1474(-)|eukprot:CAMPEP_0202899090 /NCGR_PEP_ID=MMETSP1392-20130828/7422_1 /ASSEMBLY_ACC=CAM_ASM_000868 /TAXON_ID=225041 /ORGANISM="Chlamydomonas chlamydogama, Strain SAG 11-48b" /LENGTH=177 /DNA_ID=CAMNT_0049585187 /DNA_START=97 /DNA_END=630 /DNA_ORIENTATION=+